MSTTTSDDRQRKHRFTLRAISLTLLLVLAGAALSGLVFIMSLNRSAQSSLDETIATLRASGEPVEFKDLDPRLQGKSFQQGEQLVKALSQLPPVNQEFTDPYERLLAKPRELPEGTDELEAALVKSGPLRDQVLRLVREAPIYLPHDYANENPWIIDLGELAQLRDCGRQMSVEQSIAVIRGDRERAQQLVLDEWDLAKAAENEPFIYSQLERISILARASGDAAHLMGRMEVTDSWRQALDERLRICEDTLRLAPAIAADAASIVTTLKFLHQKGIAHRVAMCQTYGIRSPLPFVSAIAGFGVAEDQGYILSSAHQFVPLIDVPGEQAAARLADLEAQADRERDRHPTTKLFLSPIASIRMAGLRARQVALNARVALRVDRYYRQHGKLPEQLDSVLDDTLQAIPIGLFSDAPVAYEHDEDSFVIHDPGIPEAAAELERFEVNYGEEKEENGDEQVPPMEPTQLELDLPLEPVSIE